MANTNLESALANGISKGIREGVGGALADGLVGLATLAVLVWQFSKISCRMLPKPEIVVTVSSQSRCILALIFTMILLRGPGITSSNAMGQPQSQSLPPAMAQSGMYISRE